MWGSDIFIYNHISWTDIRIWLHSCSTLFGNSSIFKTEHNNLQNRSGKSGDAGFGLILNKPCDVGYISLDLINAKPKAD